MPCDINTLAVCCLQPLGHSSLSLHYFISFVNHYLWSACRNSNPIMFIHNEPSYHIDYTLFVALPQENLLNWSSVRESNSRIVLLQRTALPLGQPSIKVAGVVGFEPTVITVLETVAIDQAMRHTYKIFEAVGIEPT